jgi:hypothetical protein
VKPMGGVLPQLGEQAGGWWSLCTPEGEGFVSQDRSLKAWLSQSDLSVGSHMFWQAVVHGSRGWLLFSEQVSSLLLITICPLPVLDWLSAGNRHAFASDFQCCV